MQQTDRGNTLILFFTLVVVMLGFGIIIPLMGTYVDSFGASGRQMGLLTASFAAMQFIFAPMWGSLSDRYGRKKILVIGALGFGLSQLLFGLATELWMLFAARSLAGILSSATAPTAMAYISDSTTKENRGGGMGIMGAAMGVGMTLGPGVGGLLARKSLSTPFFVAAGLAAVAAILIATVLPESLPPERRDRTRTVRGPQLREMWHALTGPNAILFVMAFLLSFALTNYEGVFSLYALERFGYGPQRVATIMMMTGVGGAVMQGLITGPVTRRWGEATVIRVSLLATAIGFVAMTLATDYWTVAATTLFFILSNSMLRPAVASLTSQRAEDGQGVAMGLNNSFMSLGRVVGPILAGSLLDVWVTLPFLSGAVIMTAGFVVSLLWPTDDRTPRGPLRRAREGSAAD